MSKRILADLQASRIFAAKDLNFMARCFSFSFLFLSSSSPFSFFFFSIATLLILPLRGALRVGRADAHTSVLLAVDVPALRRLDAHARGVPQLEVKRLRVVRVGAQAVVVEVEVLAVLA
jgi:hypothetical protein